MPDPKPEDRFSDWGGDAIITYDAQGNRTDTDDKRIIRRDETAAMFLDKYYQTRDEWYLDQNLKVLGQPLNDFK